MTAPREITPVLRVLRADNPSPMTAEGTNTYILGTDRLCVIDPGPDDAAHLDRLRAAIGRVPVAAILVTHSHRDHSALAPALGRATGAPVMAFGDSRAGRSARMARLAQDAALGGGEGVDAAFRPDRRLADGATVCFGPDRLRAWHIPGHMGNHMCFDWDGAMFTGDHVMGWAPSLISPPDGDMGAYMASLDRLDGLGARVFYTGHGAPVPDPGARIAALRRHRQARAAAIQAALADGLQRVPAITARVYTGLDPALRPAAERTVLAHLVAMVDAGTAQPTPRLHPEAAFHTA